MPEQKCPRTFLKRGAKAFLELIWLVSKQKIFKMSKKRFWQKAPGVNGLKKSLQINSLLEKKPCYVCLDLTEVLVIWIIQIAFL